MALGKFLKINDTDIPNPNAGTYKEAYEANETVYTSEAGTQFASVIRLNRLAWSGEFNVTSATKATLLSYAMSASVTCKIDGVSHSGRLRVGDISLYENSENNDGTQGLWTMTLTFEEF